VYGLLSLVFPIVSLASLGGFVNRFFLALIGGILTMNFKPTASVVWQQLVQRAYPKSGRVVDSDLKYCPACGSALG
jgi:hypothetical protein